MIGIILTRSSQSKILFIYDFILKVTRLLKMDNKMVVIKEWEGDGSESAVGVTTWG